MAVVHLFGSRSRDQVEDRGVEDSKAANCNQESAEVIELIIDQRIAKGVPPRTIYRQMEALLQSHGVDFGCDKIHADYKIITFLVQGMLDRSDAVTTDRCLMLDTIRLALAYEEPVPNDTDEIFGDLLGRLD